MSSRDWKFRIYDILISIKKIENYLEGYQLAGFKKSELLIDAVIRNFEIIGEASNKIPKRVQTQFSEIPWSEMSDMRNFLIHEYYEVDIEIVWNTVKRYLPKVKQQLEKLLDELDETKS